MPRAFTTCSDGELLRRAGRDVDAFDVLYRRHETIVAGYLVRRTRDPELAADLTSETFATALLNAKRFRDDGQPATAWLVGIARHLLMRTWERGATERRALERLGAQREERADDTLDRVAALAASDDPQNPLSRALAALPPDQREAIEAHVFDERSYAEVADDLGVPAATVRQRVSRGLTRMRTTLNGRLP